MKYIIHRDCRSYYFRDIRKTNYWYGPWTDNKDEILRTSLSIARFYLKLSRKEQETNPKIKLSKDIK